VLKICKHYSNFLQFYGTFISELYIEFLSTFVVFIKFNTNGQVYPRLDTGMAIVQAWSGERGAGISYFNI
jgi:hypothetical protein